MYRDLDPPQMARFTASKAMVKDHHFYKGQQDISWNNPAKLSRKIYLQFHKAKDTGKKTLERIGQKEKQDMEDAKVARMDDIINKKIETKDRYDRRVGERALIQTKSQQPVKQEASAKMPDREDSFDDLIAKRNIAMRPSRLEDNSWNFYHQYSKKHIKQQLTPVVLKGEEVRLSTVKKIMEDQNIEEDKKKMFNQENRENIRSALKSRQQKNGEVIRQLGLISGPESGRMTSDAAMRVKDIISSAPDKYTGAGTTSSLLQGTSPATANGLRVMNISTANFPGFEPRSPDSSATIEKLAIPRRTTSKASIVESRTELKGSLIKSMEKTSYISDNDFCNLVVTNSKLFKDTIEEHKKSMKELHVRTNPSYLSFDKTPISKYSATTLSLKAIKTGSSNNDISGFYKSGEIPPATESMSSRKDLFNEIDNFEFFQRKNLRHGYPRIYLEEAKKMPSSADNKKSRLLGK